ncbi:MAG: hypothetical protein AAFW60_01640 [Pseudomonadota bacterium]
MADEAEEELNRLINAFESVSHPNDYGFELIRIFPGLAFVKELLSPRDRVVMVEISDQYHRQICPREFYVGRTDFDAGPPGKPLWKYEDAAQFHRNDLEALHRGLPIFVKDEPWSSSITGQSGLWQGLKIWVPGERTFMWGFDFQGALTNGERG